MRPFPSISTRNKAMGRASTPEEQEYLKIPPTWGMTKAEAEERERMIAAMEKAAE